MGNRMEACSQRGQKGMKWAARAWFALLVLAGSLTMTLHAANRGPVTLIGPVLAGGHSLPSGSYSVQWTGPGPDVQLNITRDGKVVATIPAHINEIAAPEPWDSVILTTSGGGKQSLLEIHFARRHYFISLTTDTPQISAKDKGN